MAADPSTSFRSHNGRRALGTMVDRGSAGDRGGAALAGSSRAARNHTGAGGARASVLPSRRSEHQADRHIAALRKGARLDKLLAADKELKVVWPWIVGRTPLIYTWPISDDVRCEAEAVRAVARRLVALGTGLDHAVADIRLATERPVPMGLGSFSPGISACNGTLDSLIARHKAQVERLKIGSLRENLPAVRYRPAAPLARDAFIFMTVPKDNQH